MSQVTDCLDKIADKIEGKHPKIALAIDKVSDMLEKTAMLNASEVQHILEQSKAKFKPDEYTYLVNMSRVMAPLAFHELFAIAKYNKSLGKPVIPAGNLPQQAAGKVQAPGVPAAGQPAR